jgi:hypothetical protein
LGTVFFVFLLKFGSNVLADACEFNLSVGQSGEQSTRDSFQMQSRFSVRARSAT